MNNSLYFVVSQFHFDERAFLNIIERSVLGGVTHIQLREKNLSPQDFTQRALKIKSLLKKSSIPFIINDSIEVAINSQADGIHLGQNDMPVTQARKLLGNEAIIGLSVTTPQEALIANELPVNYIAASAIFPTNTKQDVHPIGLEGLKKIKETSKHPVLAIGGINASNAYVVLESGADGIAVVSDILLAPDPRKAAEKLSKIIKFHNLPSLYESR